MPIARKASCAQRGGAHIVVCNLAQRQGRSRSKLATCTAFEMPWLMNQANSCIISRLRIFWPVWQKFSKPKENNFANKMPRSQIIPLPGIPHPHRVSACKTWVAAAPCSYWPNELTFNASPCQSFKVKLLSCRAHSWSGIGSLSKRTNAIPAVKMGSGLRRQRAAYIVGRGGGETSSCDGSRTGLREAEGSLAAAGILKGDIFCTNTWHRYRSSFVVVLVGDLPRKYCVADRAGLHVCPCRYFAVSGRCEHEQCVRRILGTGNIDLSTVGQWRGGRPPQLPQEGMELCCALVRPGGIGRRGKAAGNQAPSHWLCLPRLAACSLAASPKGSVTLKSLVIVKYKIFPQNSYS